MSDNRNVCNMCGGRIAHDKSIKVVRRNRSMKRGEEYHIEIHSEDENADCWKKFLLLELGAM